MKKLLLLITTAVLIFCSCSTEFNPNDEWRETMVVYGILDQDCDTTWIRVQKCFLGEGNAYDYAHIIDSSCYAEDELEVKIVEWFAEKNREGALQKTSQTGREFEFTYTVLDNKPEGTFFAPQQPIYYCRTKGKLYADIDRIYELRILNRKTGVCVTSETSLIGSGIEVTKPDYRFQFNQGSPQNRTAIVKWKVDEGRVARVFQAVVRFFYFEGTEGNMQLKYVDIEGSVLRNTSNSNYMQSTFTRTGFGAQLKEKIGPKPNDDIFREIVDSVQIYIYAGNETLSNYMSVSAPPTTIVQERPTFSNIDGGLGIFASRRTKIKIRIDTPKEINNDYKIFLKQLDLGF